MKTATIIVLIVLGLYWLVDHAGNLPLNHESLGLYNHTAHRIIGVVLLVVAAIVAARWKPKQKSVM